MSPNAVVMSASAIPADTEASDPPPPEAAMPVNAFTIPITVPSRPTNGAVAPVVARIPSPRFSSAATISISRSTARSTERSEEHTSELQSRQYLVCRLLLEKKKKKQKHHKHKTKYVRHS